METQLPQVLVGLIGSVIDEIGRFLMPDTWQTAKSTVIKGIDEVQVCVDTAHS